MDVAADSFRVARTWSVRTSTVSYAVLLFGLLALWPTVLALARYWWEIHDYQHGFLIAAVSIVWLLALRHKIDASAAPPQPLAILPLLFAVFLWLVAFKGNSNLGQQLLLPPILWLAVMTSAGRHAAWLVAGPISFLYFAIPIWDYSALVLQPLTVRATETGLGLFGIPAVVQEFRVLIPAGTFEIAQGCSGKRYFMIALTVGCLAGVVAGLTARRQVLLICLSAGLALLANWVRVMIIVVAGHATDMQHYLVSVEHLTLGYAIFGVLLLTVCMLAARLRRPSDDSVDSRFHNADVEAVIGSATGAIPALAVLAIPLLFTMQEAGASQTTVRLEPLPVLADVWQGPLPGNPIWRPHFIGPSDEFRAAYGSHQGAVEVYVNVYGEQGPDRELVHYENTVLTPQEWHELSGPGVRASITAVLGRDPVARLASTSTGERWVVAYVYQVGDHVVSNALLAQLLIGVAALGGPTPSGIVAFATRCATDCNAAHRLLATFWKGQGNQLLGLIPERISNRS